MLASFRDRDRRITPILVHADIAAARSTAGVAIDYPPTDQPYGQREYSASDLEGRILVVRYPDLSAENGHVSMIRGSAAGQSKRGCVSCASLSCLCTRSSWPIWRNTSAKDAYSP